MLRPRSPACWIPTNESSFWNPFIRTRPNPTPPSGC